MNNPSKPIPSPDELDAYLMVLKKHGVDKFESDGFTIVISKESQTPRKLTFTEPTKSAQPKPLIDSDAPPSVQADDLDTWSVTQ